MLDLFQHEFVQNAFLAGTIVALVTAMIGYFTVLRAQAFAAHGLSHMSFAGATGAIFLGISTLVGMLTLTLLAALGMGALGERVRGRDVEIGMVLSFALGLGVLFLNLDTPYASETVNVLFGSILSVTRRDVMITLGCGMATLLLLALLFRPLLFASIDPEMAQARGVPVRLLSIVFLLLLAITVAEAVQVVGVLLVFALLIAPAASAERLTRQPFFAIVLAMALALLCTWGGLALAFASHFPVSFYIATMASLTYFASAWLSQFLAPRRYKPLPHPSREYISARVCR
jgi:zinc/manganese transport system permease protein